MNHNVIVNLQNIRDDGDKVRMVLYVFSYIFLAYCVVHDGT